MVRTGLNGAMVPTAGSTRSVMVVEDDDAIRLVLRTNLEDEGYRVVEAVTAEQALVQRIDEPVDVVLVDLRLPGIQGLDLIRSLRATSQVPIIIVTAQTDSHDVVAGLEAGADDYVTKPFVAKELMARIRTQLRRSQAVEDEPPQLTCGPIELRPDSAEVLRNGEPVPVSRIEFYVLAELIGARGTGAQPRPPAAQGLGLRQRRRRPRRRQPDLPPPQQDRGRPGESRAADDRARLRLPHEGVTRAG